MNPRMPQAGNPRPTRNQIAILRALQAGAASIPAVAAALDLSYQDTYQRVMRIADRRWVHLVGTIPSLTEAGRAVLKGAAREEEARADG